MVATCAAAGLAHADPAEDAALEALAADASSGETIEVHGAPPPLVPGAQHLDRETLEQMPGTAGNDLMQALSAMPGVASTEVPLGTAGIVIRGSSPQDSKILVDDFEIPALYHDLGFRSIVREDAIDSIDYIPGGFDVSYGRATSGIVAVTTRAGSSTGDHPHVEVDTSTGDAGVVVEGRSGDLRYMAAARRSLIDLLLPLVLPSNLDLQFTTIPRYYDEQLRLDYALSRRWDLRLTSIGSDDALELYTDRAEHADHRLGDRTRFIRATGAAQYHDDAWSAKLAVSGIAEQSATDVGAVQHIDESSPAVTARAEVERDGDTTLGLPNGSWRLGAEAVHTHYTIDVASPTETLEGETPGAADPNDTSLAFHGTLATTDLAAWTSYAVDLDPRVRATVGMRVDDYRRTGDVALEPRGDLAIRATELLTLHLTAGAYSRPPEYQSELLAPALVGERATQLIAGATYEPRPGARVQATIYDTDRTDLVARDASGDLVASGRGTTVGAELVGSLQRGPYSLWGTYAYSHSTRVDAPGDPERLFDYDQPHHLELMGSYKVGHWQLGARFRLLSGLPYTPVVGSVFDSDRNIYLPLYGPVDSARAATHHELDIHIERTTRWHDLTIHRYLDIQNVYLNQSAITYLYGYDYQQRSALSWLPIYPVIGLRADW
jgi:hypothetical protein